MVKRFFFYENIQQTFTKSRNFSLKKTLLLKAKIKTTSISATWRDIYKNTYLIL